MHQNIHRKSLKITLLENKLKVKTLTKNLIATSMLVSIFLLVFSFNLDSNIALLIAFPTSIYILYASCQILSLWSTHRKIKQKLKTLQ